MSWTYVGRLGNNSEAPPILDYVVGVGGVTVGLPVVANGTGGVITKTGGTNTVDVLGIPIGTAVATRRIGVIIGLPDVIFEAERRTGTTVVIGEKYGLEAGTLLIDGSNITQTMVQVVGQGTTPTRFRFVVLDFARA